MAVLLRTVLIQIVAVVAASTETRQTTQQMPPVNINASSTATNVRQILGKIYWIFFDVDAFHILIVGDAQSELELYRPINQQQNATYLYKNIKKN